jgi:hypothetical protein
MNVYTKLAADGTFIVVTESDPFDTFKAAKREELNQAKRIGGHGADLIGTCHKCQRSGLLVAKIGARGGTICTCHECIAAAVKDRARPAGVTLAASEMWDKEVVDYLEAEPTGTCKECERLGTFICPACTGGTFKQMDIPGPFGD